MEHATQDNTLMARTTVLLVPFDAKLTTTTCKRKCKVIVNTYRAGRVFHGIVHLDGGELMTADREILCVGYVVDVWRCRECERTDKEETRSNICLFFAKQPNMLNTIKMNACAKKTNTSQQHHHPSRRSMDKRVLTLRTPW